MNVKGKDTRAYTRLPMMNLESRDKLDSTLTPKLVNLTLESEMSENSLVCVTSDG
jgi:hypothetical protein